MAMKMVNNAILYRMKKQQSRKFLCVTVVLGTFLVNNAHSFVVPSSTTTTTYSPVVRQPYSTTRMSLQKDRRGDGGGGGGGLFNGLRRAVAKTFLPKFWTQTEEQRKQEQAREEIRDEVKSGLRTLLRDAPFPVRMVGSMVAPIVSGMTSTLVETMKEQQQQMEALQRDAKAYMLADSNVMEVLGFPITLNPPLSQSSSKTIINGKTTSQIQAVFSVEGAYNQGMATMIASEEGINQLSLRVGGHHLEVQLSRKSTKKPPSARLGTFNPDDVIDAEFEEKK